MPETIQVIINGAAGGMSDPKARQEVTDLLEAAFAGAKIIFTDKDTDVTGEARAAVEGGGRMVIVGGGDGTINAVAGALVETETVLGLLPLGTLNNFAGDLGIPSDIKEAMRVLVDGRAAQVDVGEVNDRIFVNNSGLGLYPSIVREREELQERQAPKWPAAFLASVKALVRYRLLTIRVNIGGQKLVLTTPAVFVGNSHYSLEGRRIGKRERLDDGKLCLYISHHHKRLSLLWFSIAMLFGKRPRTDHFDIDSGETLDIESPYPRLQVSVDGEVTSMETPLRYKLHPKGLRVMVPRAE